MDQPALYILHGKAGRTKMPARNIYSDLKQALQVVPEITGNETVRVAAVGKLSIFDKHQKLYKPVNNSNLVQCLS